MLHRAKSVTKEGLGLQPYPGFEVCKPKGRASPGCFGDYPTVGIDKNALWCAHLTLMMLDQWWTCQVAALRLAAPYHNDKHAISCRVVCSGTPLCAMMCHIFLTWEQQLNAQVIMGQP